MLRRNLLRSPPSVSLKEMVEGNETSCLFPRVPHGQGTVVISERKCESSLIERKGMLNPFPSVHAGE